jgi:hypothetical protein
MEMLATPLGGMLPSMAIEDGEEALASYGVEIDDEGVGILHGTTRALVFGDADAEGGMVGGMAIEDLGDGEHGWDERGTGRTPSVSRSAADMDLERALGESAKRGDMVVEVKRSMPNPYLSRFSALAESPFLFSLHLSTLVHVSAIHRCKAFAPGRQNQSKKGCCKGTSQTRASRYFHHTPFFSPVTALTSPLIQSSETNSSNTSKPFQKAISTLSPQNSYKQDLLLNFSNMQTPFSRSSSSAAFSSQADPSSTMVHLYHPSRSSTPKSPSRLTT